MIKVNKQSCFITAFTFIYCWFRLISLMWKNMRYKGWHPTTTTTPPRTSCVNCAARLKILHVGTKIMALSFYHPQCLGKVGRNKEKLFWIKELFLLSWGSGNTKSWICRRKENMMDAWTGWLARWRVKDVGCVSGSLLASLDWAFGKLEKFQVVFLACSDENGGPHTKPAKLRKGPHGRHYKPRDQRNHIQC